MTSEYNRWPDKAGPSRRHFGRAVDRSIGQIENAVLVPEECYVELFSDSAVFKCQGIIIFAGVGADICSKLLL